MTDTHRHADGAHQIPGHRQPHPHEQRFTTLSEFGDWRHGDRGEQHPHATAPADSRYQVCYLRLTRDLRSGWPTMEQAMNAAAAHLDHGPTAIWDNKHRRYHTLPREWWQPALHA